MAVPVECHGGGLGWAWLRNLNLFSQSYCATHFNRLSSICGQPDPLVHGGAYMRYAPAPVHPLTRFVRRVDAAVWMAVHALSWVCAALMATVAVVGVAR